MEHGIVTVETFSAVFANVRRRYVLPAGGTISSILHDVNIPAMFCKNAGVFVDGFKVDISIWGKMIPRDGALVNVVLLPAGENADVATFIRTAVVAGGAFLGRMTGGEVGGILGAFLAQLAIQTLIPVPDVPAEKQSYSITGTSNSMLPWGVVPKVYGCTRFAPPLAAEPLKRQGQITVLLCAGIGPIHLSAPKIGDRDAFSIPGVRVWVSPGGFSSSASLPPLFDHLANDTHTETLNRALMYAATWDDPQRRSVRTAMRDNPKVVRFMTQPSTVQIEIDLEFPDGLGIRQGSDSDDTDMQWTAGAVDFYVQYRHHANAALGTGWTPLIPDEAGMDADVSANVERLKQLTDEEWWAILGGITDQVESLADTFDSIAESAAGIEQTTYDMAMDRVSRANIALTTARTPVGDDVELTPEYIAQLDSLAGFLLRISISMGRVAVVSAEVAANLAWVGNALNAFMGIAEIIDGLVTARRSIRDGVFTDFDTLPLFTKAFVWLSGYSTYFSNIPDTAFRITNTDAVEGKFTQTLTFSGLTPGTYDVRIRRATRDNRTTENQWFDPFDWMAWDQNVAVDACNVVDVRSVANIPMLSDAAKRRYAFALVTVRASEEVNGSLNTVTFLAQAPLQWHDGTQWRKASLVDDTGRAVYRNPAWVLADCWGGQREIVVGDVTFNTNIAAVRRPVDRAKFDITRLIEWAELCFTKGFCFDFTYDKKTSWTQMRQDICSVGKATPILRDGLRSVAIDCEKETHSATITARNCRNFKSVISFAPVPEALRIKFKNREANYQQDERIVYLDGYGDPAQGPASYDALHSGGVAYFNYPDGIPFTVNVTSVTDTVTETVYMAGDLVVSTDATGTKTYIAPSGGGSWASGSRRFRVLGTYIPQEATVIETLEPVGITDPDHIYMYGRYFLGCLVLRPEVFQLEMDYERLRFELGDMVHVQHDTVMWGLGSGRITAITLDEDEINVIAITLDARITMAGGSTYQAEIRDSKNVTTIVTLLTTPGSSYIIEPVEPFPPVDITVGDLVAWGLENSVTTECVVKEIRGNTSSGASITLLDYAPDVHYADVGLIPEHQSHVTAAVPYTVASPAVLNVLNITTNESAIARIGGVLQSRIAIQLSSPDASTKYIEVQYRVDPRISGTPGNALVLAVPESAIMPTWTRMPLYTESLSTVYAAPVVDGSWYQVRMRAISEYGATSDWTIQNSVYVYGKTSPPPDILVAWFTQGVLSWEYKNPPIDHAGFKVRSIAGTDGAWESAAPAHDGVLGGTSFDASLFAGGSRVFFIKAVDVVGNESNVAARVYVDLGETPVGNIILRTSHSDDGWLGTKTGCEVSGDQLVASSGTKTSFYRGGGSVFYCPAAAGSGETNGEQPFYITAYKELVYEFSVTPTEEDLPYLLSVFVDVAQAEAWRLEYRQNDAVFWPSHDAAPCWPAKASYALYSNIYAWKPFTTKIQAVAGTVYEFRVIARASNTQAKINDVVVLRDVDDLSERIANRVITDSVDEYVPYTKNFRIIVAVHATVVYNASYPDARTAEVISKDADPAGGLVVHVFNASHARCAGMVDITIEGC